MLWQNVEQTRNWRRIPGESSEEAHKELPKQPVNRYEDAGLLGSTKGQRRSKRHKQWLIPTSSPSGVKTTAQNPAPMASSRTHPRPADIPSRQERSAGYKATSPIERLPDHLLTTTGSDLREKAEARCTRLVFVRELATKRCHLHRDCWGQEKLTKTRALAGRIVQREFALRTSQN